MAQFLTSLILSISALCAFPCSILAITSVQISPMTGASIFIKLCSFGFKNFNIICSFGKNGIDLFKNLKHESLELFIPSNLNIFYIFMNL